MILSALGLRSSSNKKARPLRKTPSFQCPSSPVSATTSSPTSSTNHSTAAPLKPSAHSGSQTASDTPITYLPIHKATGELGLSSPQIWQEIHTGKRIAKYANGSITVACVSSSSSTSETAKPKPQNQTQTSQSAKKNKSKKTPGRIHGASAQAHETKPSHTQISTQDEFTDNDIFSQLTQIQEKLKALDDGPLSSLHQLPKILKHSEKKSLHHQNTTQKLQKTLMAFIDSATDSFETLIKSIQLMKTSLDHISTHQQKLINQMNTQQNLQNILQDRDQLILDQKQVIEDLEILNRALTDHHDP